MFKAFVTALLVALGLIAIPAPLPVTNVAAIADNEASEWAMYWHEAFEEYEDEFTAIFNATEFKVSKNGRSMVKGIHAKSFKFAAK